MANTTNFSVRMDSDIKKQCETLYGELGMNLTTAINVFLRQSLRVGGFPFEVRLEQPNKETVAAMLEAEPLPQTPQFAKAYGKGDTLGLLSLFCSMEKFNRDRLLPIVQEFRRLIVEALLFRQGAAAASPDAMAVAARRTPQALLAAAGALEEAAADCRANVNTATICAALFARLRL